MKYMNILLTIITVAVLGLVAFAVYDKTREPEWCRKLREYYEVEIDSPHTKDMNCTELKEFDEGIADIIDTWRKEMNNG